MNRLLRRSLVCLLAMALFASGMPVAHATPCATAHHRGATAPSPDAHKSVDHHHAADSTSHQHADNAQPDHQQREAAVGDCNCGCFSLCAASDLSTTRPATLERRSIGIQYLFVAQERPDAVLLIDPGIPILTM